MIKRWIKLFSLPNNFVQKHCVNIIFPYSIPRQFKHCSLNLHYLWIVFPFSFLDEKSLCKRLTCEQDVGYLDLMHLFCLFQLKNPKIYGAIHQSEKFVVWKKGYFTLCVLCTDEHTRITKSPSPIYPQIVCTIYPPPSPKSSNFEQNFRHTTSCFASQRSFLRKTNQCLIKMQIYREQNNNFHNSVTF